MGRLQWSLEKGSVRLLCAADKEAFCGGGGTEAALLPPASPSRRPWAKAPSARVGFALVSSRVGQIQTLFWFAGPENQPGPGSQFEGREAAGEAGNLEGMRPKGGVCPSHVGPVSKGPQDKRRLWSFGIEEHSHCLSLGSGRNVVGLEVDLFSVENPKSRVLTILYIFLIFMKIPD